MKRLFPVFTFSNADLKPGALNLFAQINADGALSDFRLFPFIGASQDGRLVVEHKVSGPLPHQDVGFPPSRLPEFLAAKSFTLAPVLRAQLRARGIKVPR